MVDRKGPWWGNTANIGVGVSGTPANPSTFGPLEINMGAMRSCGGGWFAHCLILYA